MPLVLVALVRETQRSEESRSKMPITELKEQFFPLPYHLTTIRRHSLAVSKKDKSLMADTAQSV